MIMGVGFSLQLDGLVSRAAVGMEIPMVWDESGDCDESPWACGNSMEICKWM